MNCTTISMIFITAIVGIVAGIYSLWKKLEAPSKIFYHITLSIGTLLIGIGAVITLPKIDVVLNNVNEVSKKLDELTELFINATTNRFSTSNSVMQSKDTKTVQRALLEINNSLITDEFPYALPSDPKILNEIGAEIATIPAPKEREKIIKQSLQLQLYPK